MFSHTADVPLGSIYVPSTLLNQTACPRQDFTMAQAKDYVKVSLYIKKRPDISDQQFHQHWKTQHIDIAMRNKTFMSKVRKYNQVRTRVDAAPGLKSKSCR